MPLWWNLADTHDLESCAERHTGSMPVSGTKAGVVKIGRHARLKILFSAREVQDRCLSPAHNGNAVTMVELRRSVKPEHKKRSEFESHQAH